MKIKLDTKLKTGQLTRPSEEEENDKLISMSFLANTNKKAITISYEDGSLIVDINDDFIID